MFTRHPSACPSSSPTTHLCSPCSNCIHLLSVPRNDQVHTHLGHFLCSLCSPMVSRAGPSLPFHFIPGIPPFREAFPTIPMWFPMPAMPPLACCVLHGTHHYLKLSYLFACLFIVWFPYTRMSAPCRQGHVSPVLRTMPGLLELSTWGTNTP